MSMDLTGADPPLGGFSTGPPGAGDAATLGPVHLQSWLETYVNPNVGVTEDWIKTHRGFVATAAGTEYRANLIAAQEAEPQRELYRTARRDGRLVGFLHAQRGDDGVALHGLYLLNEAKGTGLADALMRELDAWAAGDPVTLDVASYNQRAVRFYTRHGFTPTGDTGVFAGIVPVMTMARAPR